MTSGDLLPAAVEHVPPAGTLEPPADGRVDVWWHPTPPSGLDDAQRDRLRADLDPAGRAKVARYLREADRDRSLLGHALLRRLAAGLLGGRPADVRFEVACVSCGGTDHGKPALAGAGRPELSLSHSGGVVLVALSAPGRPVGADVETRAGVDWAALAATVFDPSEWHAVQAAPDPDRAALRGWVRKEAAVKTGGEGLSVPMKQVLIADRPGGWATTTPAGGRLAGRDVPLPGDALAAVAVKDPGDLPQLVVHQAVLL